VLVNNAHSPDDVGVDALEITDEAWEATFAANTLGRYRPRAQPVHPDPGSTLDGQVTGQHPQSRFGRTVGRESGVREEPDPERTLMWVRPAGCHGLAEGAGESSPLAR
jgi:hypothetical protein